MRRLVGGTGGLPAFRLGRGRLGVRRRLARSRLCLLGCGGFRRRWLGIRLDLRSGLGGRDAGWQKVLRVEVPGFVRSLANAQVDIGLRPLARPARPERAHVCALGYRSAPDLRDGSEMKERHREAIGCSNRDRAAAAGHRAGERDAACRRGEHRLSRGSADVDSPVLARGVRVPVVTEVLQYRPARRPGPGVRGRRAGQEREEDRQQQAMLAHAASSVVLFVNRRRIAPSGVGCQDRRQNECRPASKRASVRCDPMPAQRERTSTGAPVL